MSKSSKLYPVRKPILSNGVNRISAFLIFSCFLLESIFPFPGYCQSLPAPNQFISLTSSFIPPSVRGLKFYPEDPLRFDFIIDEGEQKLGPQSLKEESQKLIKYFLAALTIPEADLWVNLSPQEPDRIIPQELGLTQMGTELLGQDYILKQLISSLTYPESEEGKSFWQKVYQKAASLFGTSRIPISTYNKIWIVPDRAEIFEDKDKAFLGESRLKVMLEEDYLLLKENLNNPDAKKYQLKEEDLKEINNFSSCLMKESVLPGIEKEVNQGKNFQELRQVYQCLILASWFKRKLKDSILNQAYINQKKTKGVDTDDPGSREKIYNLYLQAYKDGLYNYIRTDTDPGTGKSIKRRYYSGGVDCRTLGFVVDKSSSPLSRPKEQLKGLQDRINEGYIHNLSWEAKSYRQDPPPGGEEEKGLPAGASSPLSQENNEKNIGTIIEGLRYSKDLKDASTSYDLGLKLWDSLTPELRRDFLTAALGNKSFPAILAWHFLAEGRLDEFTPEMQRSLIIAALYSKYNEVAGMAWDLFERRLDRFAPELQRSLIIAALYSDHNNIARKALDLFERRLDRFAPELQGSFRITDYPTVKDARRYLQTHWDGFRPTQETFFDALNNRDPVVARAALKRVLEGQGIDLEDLGLDLASQSLVKMLLRGVTSRVNTEPAVSWPVMKTWIELLMWISDKGGTEYWPAVGAEFHQDTEGIPEESLEHMKRFFAYAAAIPTKQPINPYSREGKGLLDLRAMPGYWPFFARLIGLLKDTELAVKQTGHTVHRLPYHTSIEGDWMDKAHWFLLASFPLDWPSWTTFSQMNWDVPKGSSEEGELSYGEGYLGQTIDLRGRKIGLAKDYEQTNFFDKAISRLTAILGENGEGLALLQTEPYKQDIMRKALLAMAFKSAPELANKFQDNLIRWMKDDVGLPQEEINRFRSLGIASGGELLTTTNPELGKWFTGLQKQLLKKAAIEALGESTSPELLKLATGIDSDINWGKIAASIDRWRLTKIYKETGKNPNTPFNDLSQDERQRISDSLEKAPLSRAQDKLQGYWNEFIREAMEKFYPSVVVRTVVRIIADLTIPIDKVIGKIKNELMLIQADPETKSDDREAAVELLEKILKQEIVSPSPNSFSAASPLANRFNESKDSASSPILGRYNLRKASRIVAMVMGFAVMGNQISDGIGAAIGFQPLSVSQAEASHFRDPPVENLRRNLDAYQRMASDADGRGDLAKALEYYQRGLEAMDDFTGRGFSLDKYPELIKKFRPNFYNNIGDIYERMGELEKAMSGYLGAIRIDPELSIAYFGMGSVYYKEFLANGKPTSLERAEIYYNQAKELGAAKEGLDVKEGLRKIKEARGQKPGAGEAEVSLLTQANASITSADKIYYDFLSRSPRPKEIILYDYWVKEAVREYKKALEYYSRSTGQNKEIIDILKRRIQELEADAPLPMRKNYAEIERIVGEVSMRASKEGIRISLEKIDNWWPKLTIEDVKSPTLRFELTDIVSIVFTKGKVYALVIGDGGNHYGREYLEVGPQGQYRWTEKNVPEQIRDLFIQSGQSPKSSSPVESRADATRQKVSFSPAVTATEAQLSPLTATADVEPVGGIDLNPAAMDLEVKKKEGASDSTALPSPELIPFDLQSFQGFTFQIIKIEPITDLATLIPVTIPPKIP